jgi:hypothetical protein
VSNMSKMHEKGVPSIIPVNLVQVSAIEIRHLHARSHT